MTEWLKSKWQWLAVGLIVLIAFVAGKGLTADDVRKALAYHKLQDLEGQHVATEAKAKEIEQKSDALASELLAEQVRLEAEKERMKHAADSDVDDFLTGRGILNPPKPGKPS